MLNVLSFRTFVAQANRSLRTKPPHSLLFLTFRPFHTIKVFQHHGLPSNGLQSHGLLDPPSSMTDTQTPHYGARQIAAAALICFDNPRIGRPYDVAIELPEFTCLCPFSGYPDFAVLRLTYQPGPRVLELKALKLYVNSWRDRSISHEEVANRILDDLVAACEPVWMQLEADFNPRGNVHTVIRASHGTQLPC